MKHTSISLLFVCLGNCQLFAINQSTSGVCRFYLLLGLLGILGLGLALHTLLMYWQMGAETKKPE